MGMCEYPTESEHKKMVSMIYLLDLHYVQKIMLTMRVYCPHPKGIYNMKTVWQHTVWVFNDILVPLNTYEF